MILEDISGHLYIFSPLKYKNNASKWIPNITLTVIKGYIKKFNNNLPVDNFFFLAVKDANSFSFFEKYSIKIDKSLLFLKLFKFIKTFKAHKWGYMKWLWYFYLMVFYFKGIFC